MRNIILVSDDFAENLRWQTILKKIGFDASSILNLSNLSNDLLNFNPEIIIARKILKLSAAAVMVKIREQPYFRGSSVLIIYPEDPRPSSQDLVKARSEHVLQGPVPAEKLVEILAKLGQEPAAPLLEKLKKAHMEDLETPLPMIVRSKDQDAPDALVLPSAAENQERVSKYDKLVEDMQIDTSATSHRRQDVKKRQLELLKDFDPQDLQDQDELRKEFVTVLFSEAAKAAKIGRR